MAPSIKQALNRMNSGHEKILAALNTGQKVDCTSDASWLGFRRCASTLSEWGAIDGANITQYGRDLLAALQARRAHNNAVHRQWHAMECL